MPQIALLVAMSATAGLFGGRTASVPYRGSYYQQPQAYRYTYQPQYSQPQSYQGGYTQANYTSYYSPPDAASAPTAQPAAPTAAPAPYYYPGSFATAAAFCAPGGT